MTNEDDLPCWLDKIFGCWHNWIYESEQKYQDVSFGEPGWIYIEQSFRCTKCKRLKKETVA